MEKCKECQTELNEANCTADPKRCDECFEILFDEYRHNMLEDQDQDQDDPMDDLSR